MMNSEILEVMSSLKYLESCSSEGAGPQEDVKMRVGELLKTFDAMNKMFNVRRVILAQRGICMKKLKCQRTHMK